MGRLTYHRLWRALVSKTLIPARKLPSGRMGWRICPDWCAATRRLPRCVADCRAAPICKAASGGRAAAGRKARGKSGLHETRVAGNARRVQGFRAGHQGKVPQKANRRWRPLAGAQARVKGCGKSAPGRWQQRSHGKPHPEQGRIGASRPGPVPGQECFAPRGPGWLLEQCSNALPR